MESRGEYFDGQSSACKQVVLRLQQDCLLIYGEQLELQIPYPELRLSDALGSPSRSIYLPDHGKCDIRNAAFAAALQKRLGRGGFFSQVHRFENSLRLAAVALLLTAVVVWGFIRFAIPVLAERMAFAIPPAAEVTMGKETLEFLDNSFFSETGLPESRQLEAEQLFNRVVSGMQQDQRDYRLLFRDSAAFGANALALPGGTVVVTDDFMALVERDEELVAVLAHEIGHIRNRHALRKVIQNSTAGLLVASLTGDILSSSSIAAALPTMLVDAKYSRDMEREADDAAVEFMQQQEIPLHHFADILLTLQESIAAQGNGRQGHSALRYLSTHPATQERIERLRTEP